MGKSRGKNGATTQILATARLQGDPVLPRRQGTPFQKEKKTQKNQQKKNENGSRAALRTTCSVVRQGTAFLHGDLSVPGSSAMNVCPGRNVTTSLLLFLLLNLVFLEVLLLICARQRQFLQECIVHHAITICSMAMHQSSRAIRKPLEIPVSYLVCRRFDSAVEISYIHRRRKAHEVDRHLPIAAIRQRKARDVVSPI